MVGQYWSLIYTGLSVPASGRSFIYLYHDLDRCLGDLNTVVSVGTVIIVLSITHVVELGRRSNKKLLVVHSSLLNLLGEKAGDFCAHYSALPYNSKETSAATK